MCESACFPTASPIKYVVLLLDFEQLIGKKWYFIKFASTVFLTMSEVGYLFMCLRVSYIYFSLNC